MRYWSLKKRSVKNGTVPHDILLKTKSRTQVEDNIVIKHKAETQRK